ncbi:MAG: HAD family phosphatase [Anaerolineales bacterium]|nr:HAD family phosphatase [Anaerolineales bacterium]
MKARSTLPPGIPTMPPAAVIWDLDGLLFDTMPNHIASWRLVCQREGLPFDKDTLLQVSGCTNLEVGHALLKSQKKSLSQAWVESMVRKKKIEYNRRLAEGIPLHEGVLEWLDHFARRGYKQAIASSEGLRNVKLLTANAGIESFFQVILSGEVDVEKGKPAPDIFLLASKRVGVSPERCVVLEDAEIGVRAAKAAGMRCIAVANTQTVKSLEAADLVVDSLLHVSPEICDQWLKLVQ